mmetsp:Transcript_10672/g.23726  ORF Transcript_10672/g.23726 Transcript_10672/m.23726 type:complete len:224 (+) Transcript_10672:934-1605(+)
MQNVGQKRKLFDLFHSFKSTHPQFHGQSFISQQWISCKLHQKVKLVLQKGLRCCVVIFHARNDIVGDHLHTRYITLGAFDLSLFCLCQDGQWLFDEFWFLGRGSAFGRQCHLQVSFGSAVFLVGTFHDLCRIAQSHGSKQSTFGIDRFLDMNLALFQIFFRQQKHILDIGHGQAPRNITTRLFLLLFLSRTLFAFLLLASASSPSSSLHYLVWQFLRFGIDFE